MFMKLAREYLESEGQFASKSGQPELLVDPRVSWGAWPPPLALLCATPLALDP